MAMSESNENKTYRYDSGYFGGIAPIIFLGAILWFACGMLAGYEVFEIHEWGGLWIFAIISVLPVVIFVAAIAAVAVPKMASKRDYDHPQRLAKVVLSLWFSVTFIVTLILFVSMGLKCDYLTFDC